VTDTQSLDTKAVGQWLSTHLEGFSGPLTAEKFPQGQSNPTYLLKTPAQNYVLRRKPAGVLLKSAHAVEREFRVQKALADSDVPVAQMHVLCEDDSVIGSAFYVMEAIIGRSFGEPTMPSLAPPERHAVIDEMNRVLAAIHDVDITTAGLADYGPEGNYYARQITRWAKQYEASQTADIPDMNALIDWLQSNIPADDGQRTLVHGDYRIDNLLFSPTEPNIAAVLDWELSTIGHPYADLAAVIMQWSMPQGAEGRGLLGVDRAAHGLMSDEEFIAAYCARRGLAGIDRFGFYLAFCYFRMGAILQGVLKRALDGNASSPEQAKRLGAYVPAFATAGLKAARTA
jgi:aminoglycoside phosphotransferase (APT) family kinase protein